MRKWNALGIMCFALLLASAVRAQTGVNNAALKGDYAFSFNGMTTGDGVSSTPFAAVGRFTADGAGNLTNGELDANGLGVSMGGIEKGVALAFTGSYTIGADNRGVMNLNIPGGGTLAFVMLANGNAKFVEVDASGGHGTVGSGSMERANTSSYNTAAIVGDYAFGVAGFDQSNNRTAMAGRFTANGMGMYSNGAADVNLAGHFMTFNALVGTYAVTDGATGRGILNMPPAIGGFPGNLNFVFYTVNAGKIFLMEMDAVSAATPLLNGTLLQQQTPLGGFTSASLNSGMVMYWTGNNGGPACAGGGLLTGDGVSGLSLTYDNSCNGTSAAGLIGTYSVASDGRAALRPGTAYVVGYLVTSNQGFILVPDGTVSLGFGESQASGTFTNSSISGQYAGSTTTPASVGVTIFSGEFTADGAGNLGGTEDIGAPTGETTNAASATYSVSSSPTNGRGTISGSFSGIVYVISPTKFAVVSMGAPNSAIAIFEH